MFLLSHSHPHLLRSKSHPYLLASGGEPRVAPDLPFEVEFALAVPAQVDGPGLDVDVHQVVDNPTLDVVLDSVHQVSSTNVNHFDERQLSRDNNSTR